MPKVADLEPYAVWLRSGKQDALALAKKRMEKILATHKPKPLAPAEEQMLENVLTDAREYYRKRGLISEDQWSSYMAILQE